MVDPLYLFVFAGLFTPGPNVLLVTASGARFGLRRTLPHVAGIVGGVGVVAALAALGVGAALAALPPLRLALQVAAAGWILWMAWGLLRGEGCGAGPAARPWTAAQAALFQAVNPKVWAVAFAASAGFASGLPPAAEALRLGTAFAGINLGVCLFWTSAGALLARLLTTPAAWRAFSVVMAVLLALSALMVFSA